MDKKYLVAGIATLVLGASVILPLSVSASDTTNLDTTFIEKLANKLGISVDSIETAVTETRDEMHQERIAEREEEISTAVTNGTLTQRQADILNAMDDAMQSIRGSKSVEERESMRNLDTEIRRTQMENELVDALNSLGLNTTSEELESTRVAARSAGLMEGFRGGRGMGL